MYYIFSFLLITYLITAFQLVFLSAVLVVCQQIVLFMNNNSPKVIGHKIHSDDKLTLPKFSSYFYFLCAPTFLFRDAYPRTEKINWKQVCYHLLEGSAVMFVMIFVTRTLIIPSVQDFGRVEYTVGQIFLGFIQNTIGGCVYLFGSFIFFHHNIPNLVAELTTFGDRLFYEDWWTCTDYYGWFQKWNTWVKDWLHCSLLCIFVPICFLKLIFVAFPVCFLSLQF
jgi:sterol O-acyltransferase